MSLSSTIFWIIGTMLLTNSLRTYQMGPIRQLINGWSMFILIMSTSFSSILYSYITSSIYTDIVLEVEDMVRADYHWGLTYPPPFTFILNMQVRMWDTRELNILINFILTIKAKYYYSDLYCCKIIYKYSQNENIHYLLYSFGKTS